MTAPDRREWVALLALVGLAAALRLFDLGRQGLWYDEAWTYDLARSPLSVMLDRIPRWESTPPLYYLFAWFSQHLLGPSASALRLPGAVAGVLTVPFMWAAARRFGGPRAGLVAAAVTACSPFMWWYSQEARAYSLSVMFCALALWLLARAIEGDSWVDWLGWGVASALAVLSEYPAGLVFCVCAAVALVVRRSSWVRILVAGLIPGATGLSLVSMASKQRSMGRSDWIADFPFVGRLEQIVSQFWFGNPVFTSGRWLTFAAIAGIVAVAGIAMVARRRPAAPGLGAGLPAAIAAISLVVFLGVKLAGTDTILARTLIVVWPAAIAAVATCVARIGSRVALGATAAVCVAMVGIIVAVDHTPRLQRNDWRPLAAMLGPAPKGGRLIFLQSYPYYRPLNVYVPGSRRVRMYGDAARELVFASQELPPPRWCWWGGVCTDGIERGFSSRPQRIGSFVGFRRVGVERRGVFTAVTFVSREPIRINQLSVNGRVAPELRGALMFQPR